MKNQTFLPTAAFASSLPSSSSASLAALVRAATSLVSGGMMRQLWTAPNRTSSRAKSCRESGPF